MNDGGAQEPTKKSKNLAREIPRNFHRLSREVIERKPKDIDEIGEVVKALSDEIGGYDLSPQERQEKLFAFSPWEEMQRGVLDFRCMPLPNNLEPTSKQELLNLCWKLLDRTEGYLAHRFIEGWSGVSVGRAEDEVSKFCDELWQTQKSDPEFFTAVVTGHHGTAIQYLRNRLPLGLRAETAIDLVYRMALIWSAHDTQATAARAALSIRGDFGWLHSGKQGEGERMTASTPIAVWKPVVEMLTRNLENYLTNEERREGKPEATPTRHDDVNTIKEVALARIDPSMLREFPRKDRDDLIRTVRHVIQESDHLFFKETRNKKTSGSVANLQMSQVWYDGLTPLQVAALPIIALVQTENTLKNRLLEMYSSPNDAEVVDLKFKSGELGRNWKFRARQLHDEIRRTIIGDVDLGSQNSERKTMDGGISHDDTFISPTVAFMRQFSPGFVGPAKGEKSYRLLKLCTATRLLR